MNRLGKIAVTLLPAILLCHRMASEVIYYFQNDGVDYYLEQDEFGQLTATFDSDNGGCAPMLFGRERAVINQTLNDNSLGRAEKTRIIREILIECHDLTTPTKDAGNLFITLNEEDIASYTDYHDYKPKSEKCVVYKLKDGRFVISQVAPFEIAEIINNRYVVNRTIESYCRLMTDVEVKRLKDIVLDEHISMSEEHEQLSSFFSDTFWYSQKAQNPQASGRMEVTPFEREEMVRQRKIQEELAESQVQGEKEQTNDDAASILWFIVGMIGLLALMGGFATTNPTYKRDGHTFHSHSDVQKYDNRWL